MLTIPETNASFLGAIIDRLKLIIYKSVNDLHNEILSRNLSNCKNVDRYNIKNYINYLE